MHTTLQLPFAQMPVALAGDAHGCSHCPQCIGLVCTSTQPVLHSIAGATHSVPHVPAAHVGRAFTAPGQTLSHVPQFDVSVVVTTHEPLQSVVPAGQPVRHAPLVHTVPAAQAMPHIEQFCASVCRLTHSSPHGE